MSITKHRFLTLSWRKQRLLQVPISNDMACDLLSSNSSDRKRSKKQQKSGSVQDHLNTTGIIKFWFLRFEPLQSIRRSFLRSFLL